MSTARRQNITGGCKHEFTLETEKWKKPYTQQLRVAKNEYLDISESILN